MAVGNASATGREWIGGLIKLPAYITGDGHPYRPEALFFLDDNGVVMHSQVAKPELLLRAATKSLRQTIARPMFGRDRHPTAIRVASPELAQALRDGCPELEVRCGPTPELDTLVGLLREKLDENPMQPQSYLGAGVEAPAMAALFDAAAGLFRAAPWRRIQSDQHLLAVSIEALGLKHAIVSVVGQLGKTVGFLLFGSYAELQSYLAAGAAIARGELPAMPTHFTLHFERGSDLAPALRKQILSNAWKVASAEAHPWMTVTDEDLVARTPTADEVTVAEIIARMLPLVLDAAGPELRAAWCGGEPVVRKLDIATYSGRYPVTVVASDKLQEHVSWVVDDVLAQYAQLRDRSSTEPGPTLIEL